jgi:hypothetical protein
VGLTQRQVDKVKAATTESPDNDENGRVAEAGGATNRNCVPTCRLDAHPQTETHNVKEDCKWSNVADTNRMSDDSNQILTANNKPKPRTSHYSREKGDTAGTNIELASLLVSYSSKNDQHKAHKREDDGHCQHANCGTGGGQV